MHVTMHAIHDEIVFLSAVIHFPYNTLRITFLKLQFVLTNKNVKNMILSLLCQWWCLSLIARNISEISDYTIMLVSLFEDCLDMYLSTTECALGSC